MRILLTGGGAGGLCAPVRERVVTCGRSRMMLEVQMLVMVLLSGACTGMREERGGVMGGAGSGDDAGASSTSIVGCCRNTINKASLEHTSALILQNNNCTFTKNII